MEQMSYAARKTNRRSSRKASRKPKSRSKKKRVNKVEVAQALIVEGIAVFAILAVFIGMRSGSNQPNQQAFDSQQVQTYDQASYQQNYQAAGEEMTHQIYENQIYENQNDANRRWELAAAN
jgi:Mn2+/Fe2+ NRAMP family transporter